MFASVTSVELSVPAASTPKVVLAAAASASSIKVPPKVLTFAAGKASSALTPCAAVA